MMQQWADYLEKLKAGATVIPFRGEVALLERPRVMSYNVHRHPMQYNHN